MVTLTFENGEPNESLQIGDIAYYVQNLNVNFENTGIATGDSSGVSTMVLIGTVVSIKTNNDPTQIAVSPNTTENTFTIYVQEPSAGIIPPSVNDFIFFVKDNLVELSSVDGYYAKIRFSNNSKSKAELYAASCEVAQSSK